MIQGGIKLQDFGISVAHGIHSLTVEYIQYYFRAEINEDNAIPTVNANLTGNAVVPNAPKLCKDPEIMSLSMKILNFVVGNNDNQDTFMIRGLSNIEKLTHLAHMEEIWIRTQPVYEALLNKSSNNMTACHCVTDEENNGIMEGLRLISEYLRNFYLNSEKNKSLEKDHINQENDSLPRIKNNQTWTIWKNMFKASVLPKSQIYNVAYYLYCKLNRDY